MSFEHAVFIARMLASPWAIEREQLSILARIGAQIAMGKRAAPAALSGAAETAAARDVRRGQGRMTAAGVAVIPVYGVILQRASAFDEVSGLVSTQQISSQLQAALADETVSSILLDIDSPGGSVFGVQELADEVSQANGKKPVLALANCLAASAAYWIGSQAAEFFVTPSGAVGSIGVYSMHEDYSKALEEMGVKMTLVTAGKYKAEGNPYQELPEDARAYMQSQVDTFYGAFTRAVARGRNAPVANVRSGMGQGRVLLAGDAKAAGMVDGVQTFAQALARARQVRPAGPAGAKGSYVLIGSTSPGAIRVAAARRDAQLREFEEGTRALADPLRRL